MLSGVQRLTYFVANSRGSMFRVPGPVRQSDASRLFRRFLREWTDVLPKWDSYNSGWTRRVFAILRRAGTAHGFEVRPPREGRQGEYLVDLSWQQMQRGNYGSLALAAESEFGTTQQLLDDFGKLLDVRASLKLLVGCRRRGSGDRLDSCISNLIHVRSFSEHDGGFLVILFSRPRALSTGRGYLIEGLYFRFDGTRKPVGRRIVGC